MIGLLLGLAFALLLAVCPCRAASKTLAPALELSTQKFTIIPAYNNFLYTICLPNARIDFTCLTKLTPEDYARGVGISPSGPNNLDEKLSATLAPLRSYRSCRALCDAMLTGMELYTFSQEITTYGTSYFHTGYSLKNTAGSSFKTGFFVNF